MLFPTNPAARPGLLAETLTLLSSKPQIVVVLNGRTQSGQMAAVPDGALGDELRRHFESAGIQRVGSNHGAAVGPVWAFDFVGDAAELRLCSLPGNVGEALDEGRWINEVQSIVMNLEFEERSIRELRFPMKLEGIDFPGWERHDSVAGSTLRRR